MGFLMTQNTSDIPIRSYGGRAPIRQTINGLAQTASLADGSTAVWNPPVARPSAYPRAAISVPRGVRITPLSGIPSGNAPRDYRLMPMPTYTAPAQAATMRPAMLREGLGAVTSSEYVAIGADVAKVLINNLVAGGNTAAAGAVPAAVVKATEEVQQQQQASKAPWFIAGVLGLGVLILAFGKGGHRAKK